MPSLGCIVDDFTGGTDLSSNLVKRGFRAIQTLGVPSEGVELSDVDAIVVVLKSRTIPVGEAKAQRIANTRRYRIRRPGISTLAALLILREKVLKPVLAGVCRPKRGRPPKNLHPLDHYLTLQRQMLSTLQYLKVAA